MHSTRPAWERPSTVNTRGSLNEDLHTEVAIVGGGITGVTTALLLAQAGKRVTLLENRTLGAGVTGATTAHLTEALDTRYQQLEAKFGAEGARLARESSRAAIEKLAELATGVDCGFERLPGFLFATEESQLSELDAEVEAARRAGAKVRRTNEAPLPLPSRGAVVFEDQAQLHPSRYLAALAERLVSAGAQVFEGVAVLDVATSGQLRLETSTGHAVTADAVVLATHAPFQNIQQQLKLAQYRSYVVAGPASTPLPGLFWDMADPYHYLRTALIDGRTHLIVGGSVPVR